jgi:hypothetical protein
MQVRSFQPELAGERGIPSGYGYAVFPVSNVLGRRFSICTTSDPALQEQCRCPESRKCPTALRPPNPIGNTIGKSGTLAPVLPASSDSDEPIHTTPSVEKWLKLADDALREPSRKKA